MKAADVGYSGTLDRRPFDGCDLLCPSCNQASPISGWTEDEYYCADCEDSHYCYVCPRCHDYHGPSTGGTIKVIGEAPKMKGAKPARKFPAEFFVAPPLEQIAFELRTQAQYEQVKAAYEKGSIEILGQMYQVRSIEYDGATRRGRYTLIALVPIDALQTAG